MSRTALAQPSLRLQHADEAGFLRNDPDVAQGTRDVDESAGEIDDRRLGPGEESFEREVSTRMPPILGDEARTTAWADPPRVQRACHGVCAVYRVTFRMNATIK